MSGLHPRIDRRRWPHFGKPGKFLRIDLFQFDRCRISRGVKRYEKLSLVVWKPFETIVYIICQLKNLFIDPRKYKQGRFERLIRFEHLSDNAQPFEYFPKTRQYESQLRMLGTQSPLSHREVAQRAWK